MQKWFYSWNAYVSNEAGGSTVYLAGSEVVEFPSDMPPEDVHKEISEGISKVNGVSQVHIIAFNKV
ncbi:hypothetical protein [Enterobacter soli]|uniref:hypothetical protein n=1 Tax=Enterobacter soli TaxID=885040 RepID=UPI0037314813